MQKCSLLEVNLVVSLHWHESLSLLIKLQLFCFDHFANVIVGYIDCVNCFFSACACIALCIFMFMNQCSNSLVAL